MAERSPQLFRIAYLLTGDRGAAEDLLQLTLLREQPPQRIALAAIGNYGYDDNGDQVNVAQARFVPYPGTEGFWVIPGARGVWVAQIAGGGRGVGGSAPTAIVLSDGLIGTSCCTRGETVQGLVADGNPTVTAVLAGGATRTLRVIDNVYSITIAGRVTAIVAKDAAGRPITIKVPAG